MESFFSSFKSETIHHDDFLYCNYSFAEMVLLVQNYIDYYNDKRIVKKLGWLSPVQYRLSKQLS
jgi:transposase InsO family protein